MSDKGTCEKHGEFVLIEGCPYIQRKRAGDESYDVCELTTDFCNEEHGYPCKIYQEYLKEEEVNANLRN